MEFKFVLGVDMSKAFFNYCLMNKKFEIICEGEIENKVDSIYTFISELLERFQTSNIEEIVLIMEHTGIYVQNLSNCWLSKQGKLCIVPANKISEHLGGKLKWAEKTDRLDARRISEYGLRYSDQLSPWQARGENLELLRALHAQRRRLTDVINILSVPSNESAEFDTVLISQSIADNQATSLQALKNDLQKVEQQLIELINKDPTLSNLYKLITSVCGVGPATAREVIIATEAFDKFKPDQAKAFARYAGVVPLKKQSGKVRRKARTSKKASKKIKTVLTMGATALIGSFSDLGHFYERKIQQGKPHFCVINAMRNKLILRIFAVVRNQVMYDKKLNLNNISLDLP